MEKDNWARAKALFMQMLSLEDDQKQAFLEQHTSNNPELRDLIETLLDGENISQQEQHSISKVVGNEANEILQDSMVAKKGDVIGEYQVENIIGEGGMGLVYVAKRIDAQFEQTVAIKIIQSHALKTQTIERFRQERQILASLQHPNIAQLIGGGETKAGLPYIVMEYIDGLNIVDYCRANTLNTKERLGLFNQVLSAISYAHQNLIIHRDIKPNNVLVTKQGIVKLLDFGIAKLIEEKALPDAHNLTTFEVKVLTPANASPEQVKRENVTTRTDVYGLCTLLYQMLTEQPLFDTSTATSREVESWIVDKIPSKPSENVSPEHSAKSANIKSTLSGDLDTIILKGLQKEPERRYSSVEQLAQDIQCYLSDYPIHAKPDSTFYKISKFYRRNKAFSIVASLFLVSLLGFSAAVSYQAIVIDEARLEAVRESNNSHQVSSFLSDIFIAANPYYSGDKKLSPKDLLDNALLKINEVDADPLLKMQLLVTISNVYKSIGDFDTAKTALVDAEKLGNSISTIPELVTLDIAVSNAVIELETGSPEKAKSLNQQALTQLASLYQETQVDTTQINQEQEIKDLYLIALSTQGSIYDRLGDDENALATTQTALLIAEAHEASSSRHLANIYSYLGHTHRKLLNYEESIKWLIKSVDYAKLTFGEFNLETAYAFNQLASTLINLDRIDEAIEMAEKGLAIRTALFPNGNAEISASLGILSNAYEAKGEIEKAIEYKTRGLYEIERAVGKEHIYYGATMLGLAGFLTDNGQYEKARAYAIEARPIMQKNVPKESIDYARVYRLFGQIDYFEGKYDDALNVLLEALDYCINAEPKGHWLTAEVHSYLARAYAGKKQMQLAKEHKEKSLALYVTIFGEGSVRHESMKKALSEI